MAAAAGGGQYKLFSMDHKDIVRALITAAANFTQDRLINKEQRLLHKEQCAERLAAEEAGSAQVLYSDQAVLANLDWGIDALEEAINTSNMETKLARLDYAEKMLQVCAMLNSTHKTAGVPNFYLCAWSHLYLAYVWKLRNNARNSLVHILDMFIVDPFFSRTDFAPELWKTLFLPHMSSIVGWYSESRHRLVMEVIPDSADLSFTADFDNFFNESVIFSMRPDQADKLHDLEQLYGKSLDDNTKLYAKYYKDCVNSEAAGSKRAFPMLPIAEPPMTPLHELSRSIPDYVKFGPILPKSAGFSPLLKDQDKHGCSLNTNPSPTDEVLQSAKFSPKDYCSDTDMGSESRPRTGTPNCKRMDNDSVGRRIKDNHSNNEVSTTLFSPKTTPKNPPNCSNSSPLRHSLEDPEPLSRLLSGRLTNPRKSASLPVSPLLLNGSNTSPEDSDGEVVLEQQVNFENKYSFGNSTQMLDNSSYHNESEEDSQSSMSIPSSGKLTPLNRPPKDFVCPITSQLLSDPVTLETGQTYERKAIQEWLKRGNTTCPITRQPLFANVLPKTNYVLKRLITSWKDQYPDIAQEFSYSESTPRVSISSARDAQLQLDLSSPLEGVADSRGKVLLHSVDLLASNRKTNRFPQGAAVSTSPTSVISQAAAEAIINGIKPYTSSLCTSDDLQECEVAVSTIARTWKDSKGDPVLHSYLSKPTIVNGLAEILLASVSRDVLKAAVYLLSHLTFSDESVSETLTSVDSDFDCLATLLKNGLAETAVLIYQLRPAYAQLSVHHLIPSLVRVILNRKGEESDDLQLAVDPKDAALTLLEQILLGGDESSRALNALNLISANGLPSLIKCLDRFEGRRSVVSLLLCCMRADRGCRNFIANRVQLAPVLELFHGGNDSVRGTCIDFLLELVCLNRRTFSNQILQIIKDEGSCSTMHTFLVYIQMAPMEQQPAVACLLLQLDLLVEPRKMSIYREEAIETLIEALRRKDFPVSQVMALDAFASLSGGLTALGKSRTEAWLLKTAGLDQSYNSLLKAEGLTREVESTETMEEKFAAQSWEKRVAFVLCNHESGSIFKVLEECLKSNSLEMARSCLVIATWLTHMFASLPDTGVRDTARHCLLDQFINVLLSSRNLEEKALATVALRSFIHDQVALTELGTYAKSICKSLRKLKKSSVLVGDILKTLMNLSTINATELWSCAEVAEVDSGGNGEVLSLVYLNGRVFSSHSDGTIKVWGAGKEALRLIQETREHTKAVTCMCAPPPGDRLYSGSLDKTIRVWAIRSEEEIQCIQVHDIKEVVHEMAANTSFACFASQGSGVKIYNWSGVPKQINLNKYVKCLAMTDRKLYCGCSGYTILEVDLMKCTWSTFFSGTKKLLGKQQMIYSLCIRDGLLFCGGSSVDGVAGKVLSLSTGVPVGSLQTGGFDIHRITVNNDFVLSGTKCGGGIIDVCLRARLVRVGSLKISGASANARVTSLITDADGDMIFAASSDGKIQAWVLD